MSSAMEKYRETTNKVGTRGCSIGTLIGLALPISMIVMGALYLNDCPAQRYIPIYLIVAGCFAIILAFFRVMGTYMADEEGKKPAAIEGLSGITSLFVFAWFIAASYIKVNPIIGNVWIYGLHGKYSINPMDSNYCNNTFYLYAFWVTTVTYILMGIIIVLVCCLCWCGVCIGVCKNNESA